METYNTLRLKTWVTLPPLEYSVASRIAEYEDRETGQCTPSVTYLSERVSTSASTINRAIRSLKNAGVIRVESRYARGSGRLSSLYEVVAAPTILEINDKSMLDWGLSDQYLEG